MWGSTFLLRLCNVKNFFSGLMICSLLFLSSIKSQAEPEPFPLTLKSIYQTQVLNGYWKLGNRRDIVLHFSTKNLLNKRWRIELLHYMDSSSHWMRVEPKSYRFDKGVLIFDFEITPGNHLSVSVFAWKDASNDNNLSDIKLTAKLNNYMDGGLLKSISYPLTKF